MEKYTFGIEYGCSPSATYVEFDLELSAEDSSYLEEWLKANGPCDYACLESDNSRLFDLINDATNEAILAECNSEREKAGEVPLEFDEMDWPSISEFYWDEKLFA